MKSQFLIFVLAVCSVAPVIRLKAEDGGNSVSGIVERGDSKKPFARGEANVQVWDRPIHDDTDDDGVYNLKIPKDIESYRLVYTASGYWGKTTESIANNRDPEKRPKVSLRQRVAATDWQEGNEFVKKVELQLKIYNATADQDQKRKIKSDFARYVEDLKQHPPTTIVIPPEYEKAVTECEGVLQRMHGT